MARLPGHERNQLAHCFLKENSSNGYFQHGGESMPLITHISLCV